MVQLHLGPRYSKSVAAIGAIAQLGEHLPCKQEVIGSIPIGSTLILNEVKDPMQFSKSKDFFSECSQNMFSVIKILQ